MKRWQTKNGYDVFLVSAGRSNSYMISKENVNVLVDTGTNASYHRLRKNIDSSGLTCKKIALLILTHTHYDHCQNTLRVREEENCKILMSEKEAEFAKNGFTPLPKGTFQITKFISRLGNRIGKSRFGYEPFIPDILVSEAFNWEQNGLKIKILGTGGHSEGSICVIVDDEIAIAGDEMLGVYKNSVFPPFADDIQAMIAGWAKLLKTGCELFLPGHGKEIKRELLQTEYLKYAKNIK
jgi:hydroxyacylglutathione hydrolase